MTTKLDAMVNERYAPYFRNKERGDKPQLTQAEVEAIEKEGRLTVNVYRRKKMVCLNGYMYFDLTD